jgi:Ca2+-binding RTX toxin-like protein
MRILVVFLVVLLLAPRAAHADDLLTSTQIATMERRGWITPDFEAASRELIDARAAAQKAQDDQANLEAAMPDLENKVAAEDKKVAALQAELARYDHPDEADFTVLQAALKNGSMPTQDQMALAQAFVWTYPGSAHAGDAESDLQQLQKKIADQAQAAQDAAAAQEAAQLKLLQGVKAHDLSLAEWRAFLQDKSRDEVAQYLGAPTSQNDDYWTYAGAWTVDPSTNLKAGLQLTFNGGRVQNVAPVPAQ